MSESELRRELSNLAAPLRARLDAAGFDAERLVALAAPLFARARGEATTDPGQRNQIRGVVEPPRAEEIRDLPAPGSAEHARLAAIGAAALRRGEIAFCVLAGGMATRMGGVVKALVEPLDDHTFLELRLNENAMWSRRAGAPVPLWLMTSEATDGPTRDALAKGGSSRVTKSRHAAPERVATFRQDLGLRLTREGRLFVGDDGQPSTSIGSPLGVRRAGGQVRVDREPRQPRGDH
jgi:UTP--glucose-1-phosphate uridylyltransferase